jgi:hypothetical protein
MRSANNDLRNTIKIATSLLYRVLFPTLLSRLYSTQPLPLINFYSTATSTCTPAPLLLSSVLYPTLLCSTRLYSTLLFSSLLFSTLRSFTLLYFYFYSTHISPLLYPTLLYFTLLYSTLLYSTQLYSTLLLLLPPGANWTQ